MSQIKTFWLYGSHRVLLECRLSELHMDSVASDFTFPEKRVLNVCLVLEWLCVMLTDWALSPVYFCTGLTLCAAPPGQR